MSSVSNRAGITVAVALLVSLSACSGTPAATEPAQSEDVVASIGPVSTPISTPVPEDSTAPQATSADPDNGQGRPAMITLVLSGTSDSDGSYTSNGPARFCGDADFHLTGSRRAFSFEFPWTGDYQIGDVTFGADDLVPGSSTSVFHIGVNVHTATGGEPPATVVDTTLSGNTGSASVSDAGGTTTVTVDGSDDIGQTIHMMATCAPRT